MCGFSFAREVEVSVGGQEVPVQSMGLKTSG